MVERARALGGTTAMSGGVVWMPSHGRKGRTTTIEDSPEEALAYLGAVAGGDVDAELMRAFVSDTGRVTDEIEDRTPIEWEVLEHWPDYRGELPGAKTGGRSLWPRALRLAPEIEARVQAAFDQPSPAAVSQDDADSVSPGSATPANDGVVLRGHVRGRALVGGLLTAVVGAGIEVRTGARATALAVEDGRVVGVSVDGQLQVGRVVLASGGFQHDAALVGELLGGPPIAAMGPAGCGGDGLRMARTAGAVLGNTTEGWWMPAMHAPGEDVDGVCHYRPLHSERAQPGAVLVDRTGARFVDEAQSYGEVGQGHAERRCGPRRSALPGRAVLVGVRRRLSPPLPGGPSRTGRPRPAVAARAPTTWPGWHGSPVSRRAHWGRR